MRTRKFIIRTGWSIAIGLTALDLLAVSPGLPEMTIGAAVLSIVGALGLAVARGWRPQNKEATT